MKTQLKHIIILSLIIIGLISACSKLSNNKEVESSAFSFPSVSTEVIAPDSIKAELESMLKQMRAVHPNQSMMTDYDELCRVKNEIKAQINRPMNQLEVFRLYTLLNPVFADAHNGIMLPKMSNQIKEAVEAGDRLFPLDVFIDKDFQLMAKASTHGIEPGTIIQSINGIDAIEITTELEKHARGDNTDFRRNLLATRFAEYLWMHKGTAKEFTLGLKNGNNVEIRTLEGATERPPHRTFPKPFNKDYTFDMLENDQVGYFKANTWYRTDGYEQFNALTDSIFNVLRTKKSKHLIIDVRKNGGGDDMMWIEGILPYIAKKKWQRMTHFLGRVREIDQAYPGRLGEVAIFDYYGEFEVSDRPKFDGDIYVIAGRQTYSSAIMFTSIIKDNELGTIVGQETETLARGCSTGMMVYHDMNTTGITAFTPQHWYQRSTEGSCMTGIPTDIQLSDDPFNENQIVELLIEKIMNKQRIHNTE